MISETEVMLEPMVVITFSAFVCSVLKQVSSNAKRKVNFLIVVNYELVNKKILQRESTVPKVRGAVRAHFHNERRESCIRGQPKEEDGTKNVSPFSFLVSRLWKNL